MTTKEIQIGNRKIGPEHPPYIIAELSANHNGSIGQALKILEAAKAAGADAVKLQTYTADTMTLNSDMPDFKIRSGLWSGYNLYQLYQEAHTPWEWHPVLFQKAKELDIAIFSSPFDESAVDFLESLNAPAYKIASFEAVDLPLIEYTAKTGKPLIISTGLADLEEITEIVSLMKRLNHDEYCLLHCISGYPTPLSQCHLRTVGDLHERFDKVVGLSDHTLGITASVTSIALGASVIEKHFTIDRKEGGHDTEFSIEPKELTELCQQSKDAWSALGSVNYARKVAERENFKFRRSIYVTKDVKQGELFTEKNIRRIRPGFGLAPKFFNTVMGSRATRSIVAGEALSWSMVDTQNNDV